MRVFLTIIFLFLPVTGLCLAVIGLSEGPNYFAKRPIVIERMQYDTIVVINRFMGNEEKSFEKRWTMDYSYVDTRNRRQHGSKALLKNELPRNPEYYKRGDSLIHRIPVDKIDGRFGLNQSVKIGFQITWIFSLFGFPLLVLVNFGHYPTVKKMATPIAALPLLFALGMILFSLF